VERELNYQLVWAGGVERRPFRAPGSLRSPVLSGRALRALAGKRSSNPAKRTTETPCPTGAPLRAVPTASRRRASRQQAKAAQPPGSARTSCVPPAGQRPD